VSVVLGGHVVAEAAAPPGCAKPLVRSAFVARLPAG
jgi:hypothetical protein